MDKATTYLVAVKTSIDPYDDEAVDSGDAIITAALKALEIVLSVHIKDVEDE